MSADKRPHNFTNHNFTIFTQMELRKNISEKKKHFHMLQFIFIQNSLFFLNKIF